MAEYKKPLIESQEDFMEFQDAYLNFLIQQGKQELEKMRAQQRMNNERFANIIDSLENEKEKDIDS